MGMEYLLTGFHYSLRLMEGDCLGNFILLHGFLCMSKSEAATAL